jgi:hypothetical protein
VSWLVGGDVVELALGLGNLIETAFATGISCYTRKVGLRDCMWELFDALEDDFLNNFDPTSFRKRDDSEHVTLSQVYTFADGTNSTVIHTQYMSLSGFTSNRQLASARPNASDFALLYSRQYGNHSIVRVHHRRINDTEEGDADGKVHQMRAFHEKIGNVKRVEDREDGVVMDYLWKDGKEVVWDVFHDRGGGANGPNLANAMYVSI